MNAIHTRQIGEIHTSNAQPPDSLKITYAHYHNAKTEQFPTPWARLRHDEFGERAATVFAYLNQAHPFREGNGRTSKVFMEHVAERSSFTLDYDRVSPAQWNEASKWSGPDLLSYKPHPGDLVPVFRAIAVDRPPTTQAAAHEGAQASLRERAAVEAAQKRTTPTPTARLSEDLSAVRATFPGSARDAVRAPRTPQVGTGAAYRPPEHGRGQGTER